MPTPRHSVARREAPLLAAAGIAALVLAAAGSVLAVSPAHATEAPPQPAAPPFPYVTMPAAQR